MVEKTDPKEAKSGRTEAPEYVSARRERGKLAQRAFRQRQIDTIRSLEEENQKLRKAISDISDAARQNDVAPSLTLAISDARRVAGLPVTEMAGQPSGSGIPTSEDSGWSSSTSNDDVANVDLVPSQNDSMFGFMMSSSGGQELMDEWSQLLLAGNTDAYVPSSTNQETFDSGVDMTAPSVPHMRGPLSTMGVPLPSFEPDRAIHLTNPPPDIVPYMGAGAYTLAGQMYWSAMAFGFQAIKAIISTSEPPPAAVHIVEDVFMHTLKHMAIPKLVQLMHARLAFRRHGYFQLSSDEHWDEIRSFVDPAGPSKIHDVLADELLKAGVRKDDYLTPLDVERQLRDRFRDGYPVFEAALHGRALVVEHVACMRRLMRLLSRQSVCFGDGPRWRPDSVDLLADGWQTSMGQVSVF
ncbi:hypothetical protein F4804DRAFT_249644 [Jackrogersella minutella]|nr:hypothetical protein F4804DRAFT_249644 [Jackrogersella minutella]